MKNRLFAAACSVAIIAAIAVGVAVAVELEGIKCPVSGAPAKEASAVEFNGGKVYFCCNNCPKAFDADKAKFAAKANAQLVATKQATQKACPISGRDVNPDVSVSVNDLSVGMCCNGCKGKVEAAEGDEKTELVFGAEAFAKGFKVGE